MDGLFYLVYRRFTPSIADGRLILFRFHRYLSRSTMMDGLFYFTRRMAYAPIFLECAPVCVYLRGTSTFAGHIVFLVLQDRSGT